MNNSEFAKGRTVNDSDYQVSDIYRISRSR